MERLEIAHTPNLGRELREVARLHFLRQLTDGKAKALLAALVEAMPSKPKTLKRAFRQVLPIAFPDIEEVGLALPYVFYQANPEIDSLVQLGDVLVRYQPSKTLVPTRTAYKLGEVGAELLRENPDPKIFEFGVGTGIVGASVLRHFFERYQGRNVLYVGGDNNNSAIQVSRQTLSWSGFERGTSVRLGDGFSVLTEPDKLDLIISNPPYLTSSQAAKMDQRRLGPINSLDGGPDGRFFYEKILTESGKRINPGGWIVMQVPPELKDDIHELAHTKFPSSTVSSTQLEPYRINSAWAVMLQAA